MRSELFQFLLVLLIGIASGPGCTCERSHAREHPNSIITEATGDYLQDVGLPPHPRGDDYKDSPGDAMLPSQLASKDPLYRCREVFERADAVAPADQTIKMNKDFIINESSDIRLLAMYAGASAKIAMASASSLHIQLIGLESPRVRLLDLASSPVIPKFQAMRNDRPTSMDRNVLIVLMQVARVEDVVVTATDTAGTTFGIAWTPRVLGNGGAIDEKEKIHASQQMRKRGGTLGSSPVVRFGGDGTPFTNGDISGLNKILTTLLPDSDIQAMGTVLLVPTDWNTLPNVLDAFEKSLQQYRTDLLDKIDKYKKQIKEWEKNKVKYKANIQIYKDKVQSAQKRAEALQ